MLRRGGGRPHRRAACAYLRGSSGHVVVAPPRFVTNSSRRMANLQRVRDGVSKFSTEILPDSLQKDANAKAAQPSEHGGDDDDTATASPRRAREHHGADGPYRVITTPRHDPQNSVAAWRSGDAVIQRLSPSQWSYLAEPVVVPAGAVPAAVPVRRSSRRSVRPVLRSSRRSCRPSRRS